MNARDERGLQASLLNWINEVVGLVWHKIMVARPDYPQQLHVRECSLSTSWLSRHLKMEPQFTNPTVFPLGFCPGFFSSLSNLENIACCSQPKIWVGCSHTEDSPSLCVNVYSLKATVLLRQMLIHTWTSFIGLRRGLMKSWSFSLWWEAAWATDVTQCQPFRGGGCTDYTAVAGCPQRRGSRLNGASHHRSWSPASCFCPCSSWYGAPG